MAFKAWFINLIIIDNSLGINIAVHVITYHILLFSVMLIRIDRMRIQIRIRIQDNKITKSILNHSFKSQEKKYFRICP